MTAYPLPRRLPVAVIKAKQGLKPFFRLLCFCTFLLMAASLKAQTIPVSGTVTDEAKTPLAGVTIRVKGGSQMTTTNESGIYTIAAGPNATLVFSYVGMKTREVTLSGKNRLDLTLESEASGLDQVVVIGYGTAKKKDLTGSISTVDGSVVAQRNTTQLSQALQGSMPGLMVTRSNSEPGASASVKIRGITTIGNSDPLVIVDGVPVGNMDDVNADDIQDISVLKDAASASIYGARAASGVILITTKRPKNGQLALEYNANFGFEKPTTFPETVGVKRYLEMINEFTWNDAGNAPGGEYALYSKAQVDNWLTNHQTDPNKYPVVDWTDLLIKDHAPRQSHYLGLTAGGEKVKTQASINYEKIDGLYDFKSYERVMGRVNTNFEINKFITANLDVAYNHSLSKSPSLNPTWDALRFAPIYAATWSDGRVAQGQNGSNAYAALQYGGFNNNTNDKLIARASLQIRPTKDLTITGVFAPTLTFGKTKDFTKKIPYYAADDPTLFQGFIAGYNTTNLTETRADSRMYTKQLLVNYARTFGVHKVNALAGYEDNYTTYESVTAKGNNYVLNNFPYLDVAPLGNMLNAGGAWETAYRSYFGRVMYDYANKYFLQANVRYDGSSRFHPDYRWGAFPSVSAGWAISEENFLKRNPVLSYLKLRASWGQLGNERIGNYPYQSSINYSNALFYQGNTLVSAPTAAQVAYAIQNISWETTETVDIGLDANFFRNRLQITADWYDKRTKRMLLELEIPDYMGFENPQQNTGTMRTKGWDFQATWKDRVGNLRYSIGVNLSDSRTRMGDIGGIVLDGEKIVKQGGEYMEWYGYVSQGLFQTQAEVAAAPKLYASVKPGDVKYADISGPNGKPDGKITPDYDRVFLGGSLPRYLYGGNINLEYKGFDLAIAFQGVGKQLSKLNIYMVKPFHSAWTNAPAIIDGNYWSVYNTAEKNLQAKYPRLSYTSAENNNYVNSDYWLTNGAYFRLKNLTVGYTIPAKWTEKARLKSARVFASVTDLFSLDHLPKGWDPEVTYSSYMSKQFNFGVSVKF